MITDPGSADQPDALLEAHEFTGAVFASLLKTLPQNEADSVSRALHRRRQEELEAAKPPTPPRTTPPS